VRADLLRLEKGTHHFSETLVEEVYDYMMERLRAWYLEGVPGVTTEMFDAVLDARPASPLDFDDRLRALLAFLALPDAASLTAANKRIGNILRKATGQAGLRVDAGLLNRPSGSSPPISRSCARMSRPCSRAIVTASDAAARHAAGFRGSFLRSGHGHGR
jgi:glycyl-tRNA synthetase beta subunit